MRHAIPYTAVFLIITFSFWFTDAAEQLPPGLRPAKAFGETQTAIVPGAESAGETSKRVPPNVRTPPNLSLRSRMIAALNSRVNGEPAATTAEVFVIARVDCIRLPEDYTYSEYINSNNDPVPADSVSQNKPLIFQKGGKKAMKGHPTPPKTSVAIGGAAATDAAKLPRSTVPPPAGKNYGVNTLLQTNLVDAKGRVIKGVNSVPIRVPSSAELRNAKTSRASASQVENDAERIVPIQFVRAERHRR